MSRTGESLRARKKRRSRDEIRRGALRIFLARGYEETTVDALAEEMLVSRRTVFRYFETKDEIVLGAEREAIERSRQAATLIPSGTPLPEAVERCLSLMSADYAERREELVMIGRLVERSAMLAGGYAQILRAMEVSIRAGTQRWLGCGPSDIRPRLLAAAIIAAQRLAWETWLADDGESHLPSLLRTYSAPLVAGIAAMPATLLPAGRSAGTGVRDEH
jgi:AcrR family transcriptional regulator